MNDTSKQTTPADILDVEQLSPKERMALEQRVGTLVLDAALLRLFATLDKEAVETIQQKMEKEEVTAVLEYLSETYPDFNTLIEEEASVLRDDLVTTLSK